MNTLFKAICMIVFLTSAKISFCQEPLITDKIDDKVVIGFPGVSSSQLNQIKADFLNYDQITDAKFLIGNHNCMLITFDLTKNDFTVYAELLKVISSVYNTDQCYFKIKAAYGEIIGNIGTDVVFEVK